MATYYKDKVKSMNKLWGDTRKTGKWNSWWQLRWIWSIYQRVEGDATLGCWCRSGK
jgi:CRISPR/Cas system-associated protein Cas10 (large subunit of type III CRISPR-Cas system)